MSDARELLRELVACRDLRVTSAGRSGAEIRELKKIVAERQWKAWSAARAFLAAEPQQDNDAAVAVGDTRPESPAQSAVASPLPRAPDRLFSTEDVKKALQNNDEPARAIQQEVAALIHDLQWCAEQLYDGKRGEELLANSASKMSLAAERLSAGRHED